MPQAPTPYHNALASLIFLSRWLQAPLYLGLIVAQGVYVYHFLTFVASALLLAWTDRISSVTAVETRLKGH